MRESLTPKHTTVSESHEALAPVVEKGMDITRNENPKKLTDDIDKRQQELSANAAMEAESMKAVRARLGLPEESESDTHAIEGNQESEMREQAIRKEAAAMRESIGQLSSELMSRANKGFTPLIEPRDFAYIRTAGGGLEQIVDSKEPLSPRELSSVLGSLYTGLDGMGRADRSRGVSDSEESFGRLQAIGQSLRDSVQKMSTQFVEGNEDASHTAHRIMNKLDEFTSFTGRLRAAARNYSRS